jgi:fructose-1,6-bisphosphatase
MTRSKTELATILAKLRGKDEDPVALANEMSLMKLCYEIQKVEEEAEAAQAAPQDDTPPPAEPQDSDELTKEEQKIVEELKAPEKSTTKQKHKHILSWLLDSSSDEEES